ncbi:hypothetical protein QL285_075346 [Trifolium repens]|nr:hypothetical protein QL285_075346 [Trifolium repens]
MADTTNVTRNWGPELRADMARRQSSESRWRRQGGDMNWIAPNPIPLGPEGSSSKPNSNGTNADPNEKAKDPTTSDIFRKPETLFPKLLEREPNVTHGEEEMEEDMTEELVLESDRKRSRSQPTQEPSKQNMVKIRAVKWASPAQPGPARSSPAGQRV